MKESDLERLIAAWLDGRISESDSELLQQQLRDSATARASFLKFASLDSAIRGMAGGDLEPEGAPLNQHQSRPHLPSRKSFRRWEFGAVFWAQLAFAATALIVVSGIAYQMGKNEAPLMFGAFVTRPTASPRSIEKTMSGHASLRRVAGIQWTRGANSYREGDVLPAGELAFDDGVAEIDFFCGATIVVEGPAKLDLESDWSVRLLAGRLRANVPPAAQGFIVKAADSEIVDLGTEFALEVGAENVRVEVVDGEIKLRGGTHDGQHLLTGEGKSLVGSDDHPISFENLSTTSDVQRRQEIEQRLRFSNWKTYSQQLRTDDRLIAYYPIVESKDSRFVPNATAAGSELDGKIVGLVDRDPGRFGPGTSSLGFKRLGSRARVRVDGEFEAFTFACWARIDSLDHLYNGLFMADGYEDGEPHWQIHHDGRLMMSVMVDAAPSSRPDIDEHGNVHHIYYTEPIWDVSKSGQWMHIVSVYDPAERRVRQYINGKIISSESIVPGYYIKSLRIGAGEIGNWGQPFRDSPDFAVRNLNGAIDELTIFNAALSTEEIRALFENGKPYGF